MKVTDKHVFFWGEWPSNWFSTKFTHTHEGKEYTFYNSEQYFMWMKALTFGDELMAEQIIKYGSNPKTAKALGRKVSNYDDKVWDEKRYDVMVEANMLKYSQNKELKELLLNKEFDGKHFCEASPKDQLWGCGLHESGPLIDNEKNWLGQNLLGKVLDEVRNKLLSEKK